MTDNKEKEEEDRGFKVVDRRGQEDKTNDLSPETPVTEAATGFLKEEKPSQRQAGGDQAVDFVQFLLSLATSASLHLGLIPHPETKKPDKNLMLAKQTIDILGMLEEKTQGNRSSQEDALFSQLLTDLRLRYVEETKKTQ